MNRNRNSAVYQSKRWKQVRESVMRRDHYECQECKRFGKHTLATMVHHIYFVELFPSLRFAKWNLISLCSSCHNKMHNRDDDSATWLGLYWQEKRKNEFEKK